MDLHRGCIAHADTGERECGSRDVRRQRSQIPHSSQFRASCRQFRQRTLDPAARKGCDRYGRDKVSRVPIRGGERLRSKLVNPQGRRLCHPEPRLFNRHHRRGVSAQKALPIFVGRIFVRTKAHPGAVARHEVVCEMLAIDRPNHRVRDPRIHARWNPRREMRNVSLVADMKKSHAQRSLTVGKAGSESPGRKRSRKTRPAE